MPPKSVMTISKMNSLQFRRRASAIKEKPQWSTVRAQQLLSVRFLCLVTSKLKVDVLDSSWFDSDERLHPSYDLARGTVGQWTPKLKESTSQVVLTVKEDERTNRRAVLDLYGAGADKKSRLRPSIIPHTTRSRSRKIDTGFALFNDKFNSLCRRTRWWWNCCMDSKSNEKLPRSSDVKNYLCCFTVTLLIDNKVPVQGLYDIYKWHRDMHFCRYLFYLGKIRTIQLEYTDAKESLLQAARKASASALGFRVQCNKWAVIVRLLLGEIPERTNLTGGMLVPVEGPDSLMFALEINPEKAREEFRSASQSNGGTGVKDFMDSMGLGMLVDQVVKVSTDPAAPSKPVDQLFKTALRIEDPPIKKAYGIPWRGSPCRNHEKTFSFTWLKCGMHLSSGFRGRIT
ncbi:hypothetical protein IFM89_018576 [Coptis chinensis]|uniref:26S proteasome non-ATPase regulatory subunit 3 N-terminal TPR repeats domain-containing protein n=1 Tax=Coptis chinensis TaxID=261450 RepID=A0A835IAU7_9MAGN|nr:hypothetical protein IFM89_018576 [Coptis chinensis]